MFNQSEKPFTIYSPGSLLATILVLPGEYQSVPKPAERLKGLIHECMLNHMYECFAHKSVIHQHFVT